MVRLMQIDSPHYCAGLIIKNGIVIKAAPIIKWMVGKDFNFIISYLNSKKYNYQWKDEECS